MTSMRAAPEDNLKDLKRLDNEGRQRLLTRLLVDEIGDSFLILPREWDHQQQKPDLSKDTETQTAGSKPPITTQSEDVPESSATHVASKRKATFRSPEMSADKRLRHTNKSSLRKETRHQVAHEEGVQENQKTVAANPAIIDLTSATKQQMPQTTPSRPNIVPELRFFLSYPDDKEKDKEITKRLSNLPPEVRSELITRWEATYSCFAREQIYRKICKGPSGKVKDKMCIRYDLTKNTARPKTHHDNYYSLGGVSRITADDNCINCKTPCGYIYQHKTGYGVRFMSLPENLRRGRSWDDLHFWVLPGKHELKAN